VPVCRRLGSTRKNTRCLALSSAHLLARTGWALRGGNNLTMVPEGYAAHSCITKVRRGEPKISTCRRVLGSPKCPLALSTAHQSTGAGGHGYQHWERVGTDSERCDLPTSDGVEVRRPSCLSHTDRGSTVASKNPPIKSAPYHSTDRTSSWAVAGGSPSWPRRRRGVGGLSRHHARLGVHMRAVTCQSFACYTSKLSK
jgi:hypothetical protein